MTHEPHHKFEHQTSAAEHYGDVPPMERNPQDQPRGAQSGTPAAVKNIQPGGIQSGTASSAKSQSQGSLLGISTSIPTEQSQRIGLEDTAEKACRLGENTTEPSFVASENTTDRNRNDENTTEARHTTPLASYVHELEIIKAPTVNADRPPGFRTLADCQMMQEEPELASRVIVLRNGRQFLKPTQEEMDQRIDFTLSLIGRHFNKTQIIKVLNQRYGFGRAMANSYISRAYRRARKYVNSPLEDLLAQSIQLYRGIISSPDASAGEMMSAQREINNLLGVGKVNEDKSGEAPQLFEVIISSEDEIAEFNKIKDNITGAAKIQHTSVVSDEFGDDLFTFDVLEELQESEDDDGDEEESEADSSTEDSTEKESGTAETATPASAETDGKKDAVRAGKEIVRGLSGGAKEDSRGAKEESRPTAADLNQPGIFVAKSERTGNGLGEFFRAKRDASVESPTAGSGKGDRIVSRERGDSPEFLRGAEAETADSIRGERSSGSGGSDSGEVSAEIEHNSGGLRYGEAGQAIQSTETQFENPFDL